VRDADEKNREPCRAARVTPAQRSAGSMPRRSRHSVMRRGCCHQAPAGAGGCRHCAQCAQGARAPLRIRSGAHG
jgi:hypothetical protein